MSKPDKKTHCKRGHDIAVVGRYANNTCKACTRGFARQTKRRERGMVNPPAETLTGQCGGCLLVGLLDCDHDHATGRMRGWLCRKCNRTVGLAGDSPSTLRRLATYLEAASGQA